MYSVTKSFGLNGLRGFAVAVEADVSGGHDCRSFPYSSYFLYLENC